MTCMCHVTTHACDQISLLYAVQTQYEHNEFAPQVTTRDCYIHKSYKTC